MGMVWDNAQKLAWERNYEQAQQYHTEYGSPDIPSQYKMADGIWLGKWLYEQRRSLTEKSPFGRLTEAQIKNVGFGLRTRDRAESRCVSNFLLCLSENDSRGKDGVRMSHMEIPKDLYRLREEKRVHLSNKQRIYLKVRRLFEFCVALVAAIVLLIPFLLVAIVQKISSPHEPIFFTQKRIGKNDQPFKIIKFRSMKTSAPKSVATGALENPEMYVSRLGKFLRRTSIDELPQIYNVLLGQMSIVGPRPLIPEEEEIQFLRWYYGIYAVPPGITGLAQINGRDFVDLYDKVYYDREYVKNVSLTEDVKIILKSVVAVLGRMGIRDGKVEQSEKTMVALHKESSLQGSAEEENAMEYAMGK